MDLAGNNLDFIGSSGFLNVLPHSLRLLDISDNRIASIQKGFVEAMSRLTMINLKWVCRSFTTNIQFPAVVHVLIDRAYSLPLSERANRREKATPTLSCVITRLHLLMKIWY